MLCETMRWECRRVGILRAARNTSAEAEVANRQYLVDEQHLRVQVGGDREPEPRVHAARVALHRRIHEIRDAGEVDDLVEAPADLLPSHAHDRALQEDVLAAGEIRMKAGGQLDQRPHAALHAGRPAGGLRMRVRTFSAVDFPAPFGPMIPSA
jgi:hypothetical protein